jgi:hypothetical protein
VAAYHRPRVHVAVDAHGGAGQLGSWSAVGASGDRPVEVHHFGGGSGCGDDVFALGEGGADEGADLAAHDRVVEPVGFGEMLDGGDDVDVGVDAGHHRAQPTLVGGGGVVDRLWLKHREVDLRVRGHRHGDVGGGVEVGPHARAEQHRVRNEVPGTHDAVGPDEHGVAVREDLPVALADGHPASDERGGSVPAAGFAEGGHTRACVADRGNVVVEFGERSSA